MKIVLKGVVILLLASIIITGLYWFGKAALYKHEAKQAVINYLQCNYRGLEFKITKMHQGFLGGPFIDRAFTVSVETEVNAKQVNFLVWTDGQGKVSDYADTLAQDKLKVDAEDDVRAEVKTFIPSLKGVSLDVYYDARTSGSSPFTAYSRGMKSLMLKSLDVSWKEESDLVKADFIHKSVQLVP